MELIQRLADGELSEAERKELLQKIDDETPERWRDVAMSRCACWETVSSRKGFGKTMRRLQQT